MFFLYFNFNFISSANGGAALRTESHRGKCIHDVIKLNVASELILSYSIFNF